MKLFKTLTCSKVGAVVAVTAVTLTSSFALSNAANAGDCRQVRFEISNDHDSRVRIRRIRIAGNDGPAWDENIRNRRVNVGGVILTNRRRLNRLDSGADGDFRVIYDLWDPSNARWVAMFSAAQRHLDCADGDTVRLQVPGN